MLIKKNSLYTFGECFLDNNVTEIYYKLINIFRTKYRNKQYLEINTPTVLNQKIWTLTGHLQNFSENMFLFDNFGLKPMNCPGAVLFVKENFLKSYNSFPIKILEFGKVYRKEKSGSLKSLKRASSFIQDDRHIFTYEEHVESIISDILLDGIQFYKHILKQEVQVLLSTKPSNIQSSDVWLKSENILKTVLSRNNIFFTEDSGEGAFYGPKIDFSIQDMQLFTCQIDFFLTKKLDCYFLQNSQKCYPILIHNAILGSVERFLYFLLNTVDKIPHFFFDIPFIIWTNNCDNSKYKLKKVTEFLTSQNIKFSFVTNLQDSIMSLFKKQLLFLGDKESREEIVVRQNNKSTNILLDDWMHNVKTQQTLINNFINT